jgi:Holliday junction resolvase
MKSKGSAAERELLTMLWGVNFAAIRAAGSGVTKFYCPDVLASNGSKIIAVECKSTKHKYQYFDPEQIRQLLEFARMFKADAWLAVKFSVDWKFFRPEDLKQTGKAFVVTNEDNSKLFYDICNSTGKG